MNEVLKGISGRLEIAIRCLNVQEVESALRVIEKLKSIMPKPEQRHIDCAIAEMEEITKMKFSRREALLTKEPFYKTNKPCLHGHYSKRDTRDGSCYQCRMDNQRKVRHSLIKG